MRLKLNQTGITTATIIAIVAALLVLIIVGAYMATGGFGSNEDEQNSATESSSETQQKESEASETSSEETSVNLIESALAGGDAVKCVFVQDNNSGTAYISSENKYRVDYQSPEGNGSLIFKDDVMYTWMDGESEGIQITNPKDSAGELSEQYDSYSPEEIEENYNEENIDCEKFSFDDSLVELPSNVEFVSYDELLQSIPSAQ